MLATSNRIIFLIVVVGVAASWFILSRIRSRARKERYWSAKTPMPDEQFLAGLDIETDDHRKFCLAVRRALAENMGVSPELIHPSDSLDVFIDVGGLVDLHVGISVMEDEIGLSVDRNFIYEQEIAETGPWMASNTVADHLGFYLRNWDTICSHPERSF